MPAPTGFTFERRKAGEVVIRHHGSLATTLRGRSADRFLEEAASMDSDNLQERMARLTGNYKHGNERRR